MASSSFSTAIPSKKYDVFISFRGEDTRHNFVSHLYKSLCRNNIETYIDYRLEKGEKVWPSLEKAIQDSMMFLIVFSENYASSTWCLKELTSIQDQCSKEEGLHAIPVFYKIDPSDIRKQKGKCKIAFRNHEKSNPKQQVQKWRDALTHAANLSGWDSSTYRNEAELIQQIVIDVLKNLDPKYQDIYLDGLVGIKEKVENVELLMHNSSPDVRFIGIWGMAGIGKTTIAKALFNKLCFSFNIFCFLANVREEYERFGIEHIKNKLLSALLNKDEKSYNKVMPNGGSTYVRMRLCRQKVLVVLDDVSNSKLLESLAGAHHWFGQGSRIIITTRDKEALAGVNVDEVYEVKLLTSHQALQLFKMKAFKDKSSDEEFEWLSQKVVDYAKGLPLALTILGCSLYDKDKSVWESQLEKLRKMPHKDIQSILRLSYNSLDREEQDIFLFVACFFKRRRLEHIRNLLDASGLSTNIGLRSLQDKSLLSIFQEDVSMHDLIKEMGMEIVHEESLEDPGKRSRLWDVKDICQVLKNNKGSDAIKSITLDLSAAEDLCLSPQAFFKMSNLLFLEIYNSCPSTKHDVYLPQGLRYLPDTLRYIGWDNYPLKSLPSTFSAENLVELCLPNSGMRKLWHGVQNVVNLKKINLSNSKHLMELPDFSRAKNLEIVELNDCASIHKVHPSLLSQNKLKSLSLHCCVALTSLKSDDELASLSYLHIAGCSNLKEFSIIANNIESLDLRLTSIEEMPSCIGHMPKLGFLGLSSDKNLSELAQADDCNIFEDVDSIRLWPSLSQLAMESNSIKSLAEIHHFSNLHWLQLINCTRLCSLLQLPPSLQKLQVIDCPNLQSLPKLPPLLQTLEVYNCSSLETVQVDSSIGELEQAIFVNCFKLDEHSTKAILANVIFTCNKISSEEHYFWRLVEMRYPESKVPEWLKCGTTLPSIFYAKVSYPGSSVPEWLKYKTTHPCIIVDLSSAPLSMDWVLVYCIVTPPPPLSWNDFCVQCWYQIHFVNDDIQLYELANWEVQHSFSGGRKPMSSHVHLWFDNIVSKRLQRIEKRRATSSSKILLQVEFVSSIQNQSKIPIEIKQYGACPTYYSECQNFMNEMGLVSQASTWSSDNQDDENYNSSSISFSVEDSDEDTLVSDTCQPLQTGKMELFKRGKLVNLKCFPILRIQVLKDIYMFCVMNRILRQQMPSLLVPVTSLDLGVQLVG